MDNLAALFKKVDLAHNKKVSEMSSLFEKFKFSPSKATRKNTYATRLTEPNRNSPKSANTRPKSRSSSRSRSRSKSKAFGPLSTNSNYVSSAEMRKRSLTRKAEKAQKKGKTARELHAQDEIKLKLPRDMKYKSAMTNRSFKYRVDQLKHSGYKFEEEKGGFAIFTRPVKA